MNTRMFFEAAIELAARTGLAKCQCGGKIQSVWIGPDNDLKTSLHYLECESCHAEFAMMIKFVRGKEIPQGR